MTQPAFVRWLRKQGLTAIQLKMAAILYAVNGEDCARGFVIACHPQRGPLPKGKQRSRPAAMTVEEFEEMRG